jgi:hypothetical protein
MSLVLHHRERQWLQQLRGRGWVKAIQLQEAPAMITGLLNKGWIERSGAGRDLAYRITEQGMVAKKAPVPISR